jgi:hypothetical protein
MGTIMRGIRFSRACVVAGMGWAAWAAACSSSQSTGSTGGTDASDDGTGASDGTSPVTDSTTPSDGAQGADGADGGHADAPADATDATSSTDASDGSSTGDAPPGDAPNDADADAASQYAAYCTAYIAAGCDPDGGHGPSTVPACEGYLATVSTTCTGLATCISCAGASPVASCNDAGGPPHIAGCPSCDALMCPHGDGGPGGEGGPGGDGGPGGGDGGDGGPACPGVQIHPGPYGTSPYTPTVVTGGITPLAMGIFGPSFGSGYGELNGFIEVSGLMPYGVVSASMVMYPCNGAVACPSDLSATFGAFFDAGPGDTLVSASGCAQIPVTADSNGNLFIQISKTGDSGVADDNLGIVLRLPPPPPDGGPDAPTD